MSYLLGALLAFLSSLVYGGADFFGGLASRRENSYQVLTFTSFFGMLAMVLMAIGFQEGAPTLKGLFWGSVAGVVGGLGLAALYRGIAQGNAAIVSPIAGVVGALFPSLYASWVHGLPDGMQLAGFIVAAPAIWLVTKTPSDNKGLVRRGLILGVPAGVAFGIFFVATAQLGGGNVFGPLAIAKFGSLITGLVLLFVSRSRLPTLYGNPAAFCAALMDATANVLYLMATRYTRLDVAAVLSSLYPAGTVVLARLILKEQINSLQWVGIVLSLLSISLITLAR